MAITGVEIRTVPQMEGRGKNFRPGTYTLDHIRLLHRGKGTSSSSATPQEEQTRRTGAGGWEADSGLALVEYGVVRLLSLTSLSESKTLVVSQNTLE